MTLIFLILFLSKILAKPIDFIEWMKLYNKTYSSYEELNFRKSIYEENTNKILDYNLKNEDWKMVVTKHTDLTELEFKNIFTHCNNSTLPIILNNSYCKNGMKFNCTGGIIKFHY
jgi:hypothetical protein